MTWRTNGSSSERRTHRRRWCRAAGLELALAEGWLPFFMQWDDPAQYPGVIPVRHLVGTREIAWLELTPADPERLRRWLGPATPPLRIVEGRPGLHRVVIRTDAGELVLP
jgi:hypothetical protein